MILESFWKGALKIAYKLSTKWITVCANERLDGGVGEMWKHKKKMILIVKWNPQNDKSKMTCPPLFENGNEKFPLVFFFFFVCLCVCANVFSYFSSCHDNFSYLFFSVLSFFLYFFFLLLFLTSTINWIILLCLPFNPSSSFLSIAMSESEWVSERKWEEKSKIVFLLFLAMIDCMTDITTQYGYAMLFDLKDITIGENIFNITRTHTHKRG